MHLASLQPLFVLATLTLGVSSIAVQAQPRAVAYADPTANGGSMLDDANGGIGAPDLGEPLNVIISGLSSPDVLTDSGFLNYVQAIGYSFECLGLHIGTPQTANLGDGNGWVAQTVEYRQDYGNSDVGTCLESLIGGDHFRMYRQNGSAADTGALFLAVSKEEPATENHNIIPNGYDIGRDLFSAAAIGTNSHGGVTYTTTGTNVTGLLAAGSNGVNHGIATDGITTLLTVTIV
ncbi:unnamed protein product [Mycena citricolor]|uniref:Secreted protein n=1 Tax=Mycena citricolor TaxID=2018698 RepID=A0AAD2Q7H1_9AGAR|nr:unnamed protein product [Mycena citricolor]